MTKFNIKLIDNVTLGDINHWDYPEYCDAFVDSADYNGKPMTDEELDELNEDAELVYELLWDYLH
jgi:hypothetical protein